MSVDANVELTQWGCSAKLFAIVSTKCLRESRVQRTSCVGTVREFNLGSKQITLPRTMSRLLQMTYTTKQWRGIRQRRRHGISSIPRARV